MSQFIMRNSGLTAQVEQAIRDEIGRLQPGCKLPTERMLADRFHVSIVKVREALTLLAREGRIERCHGRGTFVREPPARDWVAVVLVHDLAHPSLSYYGRAVFQSLRKQLNALGVPARGYVAHGDPATYDVFDCPEFRQDLEARRLRHVIPVGGDLPPDVVGALERHGVARTLHDVGRGIARQRELVRAGVRYLRGQGRRRLALLAWTGRQEGWGKKWNWPGEAAAFKEELGAAGLSYRDAWVRGDLHPNLAGAGWEEFREIWRGGNGRPDGLLIANDLLAHDAAIAIAESGIRVPDDLLVVAHANKGSGQWFPFPVARLLVDPEEGARALVRRVLRALGKEVELADPVDEATFSLVPLAEHGPQIVRAGEGARGEGLGVRR